MGQFSNSVAAHPRTNEVEVTPRAYFLVEWPQLLHIFPSEEKIRLSSLTDFFASLLEIQMAQFN